MRLAIDARLQRFQTGNLGKLKGVGEGVFESKIEDGPGYRIYFGKDGDKIIILLLGGDKASQASDIALAKEYWKDYKKRKREQEHEENKKTKAKPNGKR